MLAGSRERINNARAGKAKHPIGSPLVRMRDLNNEREDEPRLESLYSELTGASEACARSVFMFVCSPDAESETPDKNSPANKFD
jgi:hypothetical protein